MANNGATALDFIRTIVTEDLKSEKHKSVLTRFPPEPNGYLHIGHAKAICLNYGIAEEFGGSCNLRLDDSNPSKEEVEYVESILRDVQWLGFNQGDLTFYASDYFEQMHGYAEELIQKGKAYVCELSPDEIRDYRGTLTQPGKNSPYRDRPMEESLHLFRRMRSGEFREGECVLRAKIDMASPNLNMRDPVVYRVKFASHHRTGDAWCIYPMYDFCHCLSDSIEGITHSICTLEFEDHRPLYDWYLDQLDVPCHPQQIEFARLNLTYTVLSKRKLAQLVSQSRVDGWDDPRMPTLAGMRRRGYTPQAIRAFCEKIGVSKANSIVDLSLLEFCLREHLNATAARVMGILRPVKLVIDNYPEAKVEELDAENNPEDESQGTRRIPFSRELYVERDDYREDPPKDWFRLAPGKEVRLKHAYYVTCTGAVKDTNTGEVMEIHCTYDPQTRGGWSQDGRKVKGTLSWVSAEQAISAEVRLYDNLFSKENPDDLAEGEEFTDYLNPNSLEILEDCKLEPSMKEAQSGVSYQFLRQGYFCLDSKHSTPTKPVFNRTVTLRDTWAKIEKKSGGNAQTPQLRG